MISNTAKEKKSHVGRSGEQGGHGTSPKREMRCPGNIFRTMVIDPFAVCAVAPSCWNHTLAQPPPLGLTTEHYPFKRCQILVGHSVYVHIWYFWVTDYCTWCKTKVCDFCHMRCFSDGNCRLSWSLLLVLFITVYVLFTSVWTVVCMYIQTKKTKYKYIYIYHPKNQRIRQTSQTLAFHHAQ